FTTAGRVADVHGIAEIEVIGERSCIGRVVVHVVAVVDVSRPAVSATVVCNDAIAALDEVEQLRVPVVAAERPAVMEHDGPAVARAPVLVGDGNAVAGT